MNTKRWVAVGATSALGLGVLASGALSIANAMPLYETSTATDVPPISTAEVETKAFTGTGDVRFWVTPTPTSAPVASPTATPSVVTPSPATPPTVQPAPVPAPQPLAPAPTATENADSGASPVSVASVDSVD